jgi:glycosyltransferase involved in cell wall biosynthesis
VLLEAVAQLEVPFSLCVIGDGPERERLNELIAKHGLENRVTLKGGMTHAELPEAYRQAHLVVVPSIQDQTGDRDGLPNVVLEALASGRAVVASRISAIGSAITHGETGLLVAPGDSLAIAAALEKLYPRPALREQFGRNGRERVERDYEIGRCAERFHQLLASIYA